jgi:hypothetical protein
MNNKNIAAISVKEIENTIGALKELRQRMPFLMTLSPLERRHGATVGPSRVQETQASLAAAREYPAILPSTFDLARFEHSAQATVRLHQCLTVLKGLTSDVQDTLLSVGADAITGAQQVRALVKAAAKTTPGLSQLLQDLTPRAPRPVSLPVTDTPAAETSKTAPESGGAPAPAPKTSSETPAQPKAA